MEELGVRLVLCSRWAAYAAKMPRGTYDQLADLGSSIGRRLRNAQRESIESLWARAAVGADHPQRKGLPARCDRSWFINTFCGGNDDPLRTANDPVWDLVDGFMQYDTMALFAAVPFLRAQFYDPVKVTVDTTEHLVVGPTQDKPSLLEPKTKLMDLMHNGFRTGIMLNHHFKAQVILIGELRPDTVVDMSLSCAMLRTLFELGTVHCVGIVAFVDPKDQQFAASNPMKTLRGTLDQIGLRFVPVRVADDATSAAEHLTDLYQVALPVGVTIVNTASLSAISKFAAKDTALFCEKTARVILMGGVQRRGREDSWLEPDPSAQNNRLDLEAAWSFYKTAQDLSVPLVVLSRFATQGAQVPRALFDILKTHGGSVGQAMYENQRASLQGLWLKANEEDGSPHRGNLPSRCDRAWFLSTFCHGGDVSNTEDIWTRVNSLNVYSSFALLVALPGVVRRFFSATSVEIRATTHHVIGWSADDPCLADSAALQRVLAHCMLYGCHCNFSAYSLVDIPTLQMASGETVKLEMNEEEIQAVIPKYAAYC
eukprot:gb/GFBE01054858.1/.p1 GENE.gb/GFBE01054858.1/~~gb/GFBE01054858.1/.p1  ORF type:complete len:541 (+),score=63.43 gb/GFBE01054858.1/:1-1623(+)